ncbi:protein CELLULOSE SYNTHASE INTERACTIVE 3 [Primulina huaijiensis]|uniref:protein CELLULOSE SYNTHASE INTERACTIVE 3 n=1 Tax=Primulina huaijiensis TaxID=1492673 RepID=UPI003CC77431
MSSSSPVKRTFRKALSLSRKNKVPNGTTEADDPDISRVAQLVDQLHANVTSAHEKELTTARLLGIAKTRKEARAFIISHDQAMPLFVSILRNGTLPAKINVAATLSILCRTKDFRVKVLLGGCIPPLLSLLKSNATEARKAAAEAIYAVSSSGISDDQVGMKIFVTEGVVQTLWDQLNVKNNDKTVEEFVTGALRNLCGDKEGYWQAILDVGGVDIIVGLLSSENSTSQSNAASLLAHMMLDFPDSVMKIVDSGAIKSLLGLLSDKKDVFVRASAAEALEALSIKSKKGKESIVDAQGIPLLIGVVVAPSKEGIQGEVAEALQRHSMQTLANICGGMFKLILHLGELSQSPRLAAPVADIIGALAHCLMVFKQNGDVEPFESTKIESILIMLLKPRDNKQVQERLLEAMACLYGNAYLSVSISQSEAKKVLVGLITMVSGDAQECLIFSLIRLCTEGVSVWEALGKREGIQLLISSFGLSNEKHQEYTVKMLSILTKQVDDSKWALTSAGGVPPLVRLLEVGSEKARYDAAHILWNLCHYSEDIRVILESAEAVPAFIRLLKNGGPEEQEVSANTLIKLVKNGNPSSINQLLALLLGDSPSSKTHVIKVLGHVLSVASLSDLVNPGATAYKGLKALVQLFNSSNERTREHVALVLADLFINRQDLCDGLMTDEAVIPCMKILTSNNQGIATKFPQALNSVSHPIKFKKMSKTSYISEGDIKPLIRKAKTLEIDSAERAMAALSYELSDPQVAAEALAEDIISAITRVLGEGSLEGKQSASRALHQLLKHFPVGDVLTGSSQCRFIVLEVIDSLNATDVDSTEFLDTLEVVSLLSRTKLGHSSYSPWSGLAEVSSSLDPLLHCLCEGPTSVQDKAIEILSRLSTEQPAALGDVLFSNSKSIGNLANRIMNSRSQEVRVGGTTLLICVAKEHKIQSIHALEASGYLKPLIYTLVDMMKQNSSCSSVEIEVRTPRAYRDRSDFRVGDDFDVPDPATVLGGTVALWLLSIISSFHSKSKITMIEAGALEILSDKFARHANRDQAVFEDTEGIWISALLAAILFQDTDALSSSTAMSFIQSLSVLFNSDEMIDRFFAAQAFASLVGHENMEINLAIANSGTVCGLMSLIGHIESDMPNVMALSEEFSLVKNPDQIVLESLFQIDEIRVGPISQSTIPLLVDLLRPIPNRPGAPSFSVRLLTQIAHGNDTNKLFIAEAGALDALTKYLSLSPQDLNEATVSELLRIMFSNPDLVQYESALSCMNQLVAVLHLGSKSARLSAARAINELFDSKEIRDSEASIQAIQPLADMLDTPFEYEQQTALSALIKLTSDNYAKAAMLAEVEGNLLVCLHKIISSVANLKLKSDAAKLCCILFGNSRIRESPITSECIGPLILLMQSDEETAVESSVRALGRLLEDENQVDITSSHDLVGKLVYLVSGPNHMLIEASISTLIKLGKDRTPRKLEMVNLGIIDNCLKLLPTAPNSLCTTIAELFRILTNSSAISKSLAAARSVEPFFMLLFKTDFDLQGQHSALQVLVNILEKPRSLSRCKLTPNQVIEPLISVLESPSQAIQQLGAELLSHLLDQEHFPQDMLTKNAILPLVHLVGIGILNLQQTAIKALENISLSWPKEVSDAGGIFELSKVIVQEDPLPSDDLLESAALVLSNLLRFDADYYFRVPVGVLVKMLYSGLESTVVVAINSLIVQEKADSSSAELMAEAGAIDALLDLVRSHHCEEVSGTLLEELFNNTRVREMKACKYAIAPLAQYLLDPQTRSENGRLLAALALGNLSQHEGLARASDSASACRALVFLLEDQPTKDMQIVAVCALQNFVMHSRTNRRTVAEAGGVLRIQELLLSSDSEVVDQTTLLVRYLFSNHTLQEYASNELLKSLTAVLEKEESSRSSIKEEEILKTIHVILSNFHKLHVSEATTLCIPHLLTALKSGTAAAQDSALTTLCLLKHTWSTIPIDMSKSQAMVAAEAIPFLQIHMKTCPPNFLDRIESLLHSLPGCLTVAIKRADNLKQVTGGTNAFCQLSIGHGSARYTKVVSHNTSPEWEEKFTWAFDVPPKGQNLNIVCRSRNTFGKTTLGRVTIPIDKVVNEGSYSDLLNLGQDTNKDGSSRTLELEMAWSNSTWNENV